MTVSIPHYLFLLRKYQSCCNLQEIPADVKTESRCHKKSNKECRKNYEKKMKCALKYSYQFCW